MRYLIKAIIYFLLITIGIYFFIFAIYSFSTWTFNNPMIFFINIPTYDPITRGFIFFLGLGYIILCPYGLFEHFKEKAKKEDRY